MERVKADAGKRRDVGWRIAGVVAPVAFGLLLVTCSVWLVAGNTRLHDQLFERHRVTVATGLSADAVRDVNRQVINYFASEAEPLSVTTTLHGAADVALFDASEVSHMADVKQLLLRTYRVLGASALFLLVLLAGALIVRRGRAGEEVATWLRRGALGTAAAILVVGFASVVAFGPVFRLFHLLGFPQGNFTFNASTSYLVRIYPAGFFQDMALIIGALTLTGAALAWLAARAYMRRRNAASKRAAGTSEATPRA